MAFCRNCGQEMPDGTKFCRNCGTEMTTPAGEAENERGNEANTSQAQVQPREVPEENKFMFVDKIGKFIGILLMVISIIAVQIEIPVLQILIEVIVIAGCIFCFSRKYKLKGFTIVAFVLSILCLIASVGNIKDNGLFGNKNASSYASSMDEDDLEEEPVVTIPAQVTLEAEKKKDEAPAVEAENAEDTENAESDDKEAGEPEGEEAEVSEPGENEEAETEEAEEPETEEAEENQESTEVTPELKEFLDSYEEFMNEYVDFMEEYSKDSGNVALMTEYLEILQKYEDFAEKAEAYDEEEMTEADAKYYIEVTARIEKKLIEAAYLMN